jgi:hypothetical protein
MAKITAITNYLYICGLPRTTTRMHLSQLRRVKLDRGYYRVCLEQKYPQTHVSLRRVKKAWKKVDSNLAAVPAGRIEVREMRQARDAALREINDRIGY